jgi:two-component system, LytTR family, sensor kinase
MNTNKDKLFWTLNLSWWVISIAYATLPTYKLPEGTSFEIFIFYSLHYVSMVVLTFLYKTIYNRINPKEQNHVYHLVAPIVGVTITGGIFFLLNSHDFIYHYKFHENRPYTLEMRFAYLIDCIWDSLPWFMGYHLFRYARISTERENELQESLHDSELDRLKKQLNPHFLFNALNGIRALVLTEPHQSREAIGQLSDLLRLSLKMDLNNIIPLSEEMEILENYLAIEKIRFHERLSIEINIPNEFKSIKVVPFCLQILAENAVKHGVGKQKLGGGIKVLAEKNEEFLLLKVINSGKLFTETKDSKESTNIGLDNLKRRLALNFGEKATFSIVGKDNLVTATITLPINSV